MRDKGHNPVMKEEVLKFLSTQFPGAFLDMTFGGGGHTAAILEKDEKNRVTAVDCDPEAFTRAAALKGAFPDRFAFIDSFFDEVDLRENSFDGVIFDLGVSSFQFDAPERGFSFREDAPADMRMNPRQGTPAWKLLENSDRKVLEHIVRDYAEEPRWRAVVDALEKAPGIRSTKELSELVSRHAKRTGKIHPATRVFMGIRMAVNDEIGRLERALPKAFESLKQDGVLAVISFHSVEDRVVKIFFQKMTRPLKTAPAILLVKKVERPGQAELATNPRSRSAKLRVLQKRQTNHV